jgi:site-specific recombinase XerD
MSVKYSNTTADYLEWDTMLNLVRRLFKDGNYRMSLLIGLSSFIGTRISDTLTLTWDMIYDTDSFTIIEKKTGKKRIIKINDSFQKHIKDCFNALNIKDRNEKCFLSNKKSVYTVQRINVILKEIKERYNIKIEHFSTHSLRKTFGRKVVENAGENSEMALIKLSELFNHSSPQITRKYLGLRHEELMEVYDTLTF